MFDPFKDFETSGYLRNKFAEKNPQIVQELEHQMFRVSLDEAITHLAKRRSGEAPCAMKISSPSIASSSRASILGPGRTVRPRLRRSP